MKKYFVFEYKDGCKVCVSNGYPTWLGCKRVLNRLHYYFPFDKYSVEAVEV